VFCLLALDYGLAALGIWRLWKVRRFEAVACLAPIAYLIAISAGGWAYYRHRLPILPLISILGAGALPQPPP
jgi:uncharacterized membrane protein YqjE